MFFKYFLYNQTNQNSKVRSSNNQHTPIKTRNQNTPTKIENPEINIHQQSNPETDLHIQKFEPNIHPLKSKDLYFLCSQNQHQSPSWKPTNSSKHKIKSNWETHRSPPSSKSHHSLEPTLWNHNTQTHKPTNLPQISAPIHHKPRSTKLTTHKPKSTNYKPQR